MSNTQGRDFNEVYGLNFEDLKLGQTASLSRTVSEADILMFAGVSGDNNPVHMDEAYAARTPYRGRIAHGLLSASFGSAVVGTQLPGAGAIYLHQTLEFKKPVRIGDRVTARVTVAAIDEVGARVTLKTEGYVGDELVMGGEALVRVPRRRKPAKA